jgi:uncharacterized protein
MRRLAHHVSSILCAALLFGTACCSFSQESQSSIVIGEQLTITSQVLHEDRHILVSKPADYDDTDARYPVLYVLDGDTSFNYTTTLAQFLATNRIIPHMLVVAIPNTARLRDLTPASTTPPTGGQAPQGGGAAEFRAFIANELIPWVEANYRTHSYRILVGHSLGGLFAVDTFVEQPKLFNAYVAISPSLWWDDMALIERASTRFATPRDLNASLYMTVANEPDNMPASIRQFAAILDEHAPTNLAWKFDQLPLESHGSTPLRSTYQGLEFIFADWSLKDPLDTYNRYGIEAVERFYFSNAQKYNEERSAITEDAILPLMLGLMDEKRIDELAVLLDRYRDVTKPRAGFFEDVADDFRQRGLREKAIDFYQRALEVDPERAASREALAELNAAGLE